jgi:hypothetical protein
MATRMTKRPTIYDSEKIMEAWVIFTAYTAWTMMGREGRRISRLFFTSTFVFLLSYICCIVMGVGGSASLHYLSGVGLVFGFFFFPLGVQKRERRREGRDGDILHLLVYTIFSSVSQMPVSIYTYPVFTFSGCLGGFSTKFTIYSIIHSSTRLPDNSWSSTRPLTSVKRK